MNMVNPLITYIFSCDVFLEGWSYISGLHLWEYQFGDYLKHSWLLLCLNFLIAVEQKVRLSILFIWLFPLLLAIFDVVFLEVIIFPVFFFENINLKAVFSILDYCFIQNPYFNFKRVSLFIFGVFGDFPLLLIFNVCYHGYTLLWNWYILCLHIVTLDHFFTCIFNQ